MKIAHLIIAHQEPQQLARLLDALAHADVHCYVHLPQHADAAAFDFLRHRPRVCVARPRPTLGWDGCRHTQAIVEGLRAMLAHAPAYEFMNVLSAQDYPLRSAAQVQAFLAGRRGESFLATEPADGPWWQANRRRVSRYHYTEFQFPGRCLAQPAASDVLPAHELPLDGPLHGGPAGSWFTLSREAAAYLVRFLDKNTRLRRFARLTWGANDFLVPSVLLNSPLAASVTNDNLRCFDWHGGAAATGSSLHAPVTLPAPIKLWARAGGRHKPTAGTTELGPARHEPMAALVA